MIPPHVNYVSFCKHHDGEKRENKINPLLIQFKSLLHGQEGCFFFSGHLNVRKYQYVLVRLGRQAAFKSSTL
jgi:hypothetical protein